ncbi:MAG: phosphate/phosphite/phosphonate ABC transporter substrate-binding protein [Magnetococcus sp. YQC-5]
MKYFKTNKFLLIGVCLLIALLQGRLEGSNNLKTLYFYNPETNIDNFAILKKEFDLYFAQYGEFYITPFSKMDAFEQTMTATQEGLFLVSSWHFKTLMKAKKLKPLLIGVIKGGSTHKKVLVVEKKIASLEALRGKQVASSSSKEYTQGILKEMLETNHPDVTSSLRIITVPKDMDALMSVTFGMAESALTTQESLEQLALLNPTHHKRLTVLALSDELLLPIVSISNSSMDPAKPLIGILERMGADPAAEEQLRMLGLDGFRPLSAEDKKRLER